MSKFTWDVFYASKEGFSEHISVETETAEQLDTGRKSVLTILLAADATPRPADTRPPQGGAAPRPLTGGQRTGQAAPRGRQAPPMELECEFGHGPMKFIPAGVSKTSGKRYGAFFACDTCKEEGTKNTVALSEAMSQQGGSDMPF